MKNKLQKYFPLFLFIPLGIVTFVFPISTNSQGVWNMGETVEFLETATKHSPENEGQFLSVKIIENLKFNLQDGLHNIRIWIPLASDNKFQSIELLKINTAENYKIIKDPDFNNDILFIDINNYTNTAGKESTYNSSFEIEWEYEIKRKEQNGFSTDSDFISQNISNELYLQERGYIIIDDRIRDIAKTVTAGISDSHKKAKAIYDYVLTHVDYDTSIPGWGKGDVVYACDVGKGNCTDFHSLFISLARAADIPARFRIGYPIPSEQKGRLLKPYHCWAEFFIEGKGWSPVDISEAWKNPNKADYYFGNLDKDRILISTGRNINLLPGDDNVPLANYFVKPYIELDGRSYDSFEIERSFAKIKTEQ